MIKRPYDSHAQAMEHLMGELEVRVAQVELLTHLALEHAGIETFELTLRDILADSQRHLD